MSHILFYLLFHMLNLPIAETLSTKAQDFDYEMQDFQKNTQKMKYFRILCKNYICFFTVAAIAPKRLNTSTS